MVDKTTGAYKLKRLSIEEKWIKVHERFPITHDLLVAATSIRDIIASGNIGANTDGKWDDAVEQIDFITRTLPQSIGRLLNACSVVLGVHGMDCLSEGDVTSKTVWLLEPTSNRIIIDPLSWTELIEERVPRKKRSPMRELSRSLFSGCASSTPIGKRQPPRPAATIAPPVLLHSPEEIISRLRVVGFGRAEMITLYPIVEDYLPRKMAPPTRQATDDAFEEVWSFAKALWEIGVGHVSGESVREQIQG
jgi:hypothetical protein